MAVEPVHVSEIKSFLRCRLAWFWSAPPPRGLFLEPRIERTALHFGRLIHKALQIGYDYGVPYADAFKEESRKVQEVMSKDPYLAAGLDKMLEQEELGITMLEGYQEWAKQIDEGVRFISTEMKWRGKVGLRSLAGRFDALVERADGLWILDFKTTSSSNTDWTAQDLQATAYVHAARQIIDKDIRGLLFRFLLKSAPYDYNNLILKKGGVTQRKNLGGITTYREYMKALAVATLKDLAESSEEFRDLLGLPGLPTLDNYAGLLDGTQHEKPWHPVFKNAFLNVRRMYYSQLQDLKGPSKYFWEVEEFRTDRQVQLSLRHVLEPAMKEMTSRRKGRWIGPTGLGAAFSVCKSCRFQDPCQLVLRGADHRETLNTEYQKRKEEVIE